MRKWEEKMYGPNNEYSKGLPFFDIIFKTVVYSVVYNWYVENLRTNNPEFTYMWCPGRKYDPMGVGCVAVYHNQIPKRVRERFEEIKPLFYLMR